jgi:hypothetical protein
VTVERLARGRAFHDAVQSAFLTDLTGATGFKERGWRLTAGGRGRVDLAVVTDDRDKMLIIIEIKGTDWDNIRTDRVKRNVQRHIRQLLAYLDTAIAELETGQWEGVAGALLYPSRPASADSLACIEAATAEQAIMLTWYHQVSPLRSNGPDQLQHFYVELLSVVTVEARSSVSARSSDWWHAACKQHVAGN